MITAYPVLSQQIKEREVSLKELATKINVSIVTMYLKMWGIKRWTLTDAVIICCFFNIQDAEHLFRRSSVRYVR